MQANGIPESQMRLWVSQTDVPITVRGQMRGWVEDWATWPVRWWPVEVHERAVSLGEPDAGDDLGVIAHRYRQAIGQVRLRWSPSLWPFTEDEPPPKAYLADQSVAYHAILSAVHTAQCQRTNADLLRDLATITMPCERVHARLGMVGIPWSHERGVALCRELDDEILALRRTLDGHGISDPGDDVLVGVWLMLEGFGHLFPRGVDAELLREYDSRHPAFHPLRRLRRLRDLRDQSWLLGQQTGPGGSLHLHHRTLAAPTGRSTSVGPALGSVPKEYRVRILTPDDPDLAYDDVDFSGFELFVAAAVSGDAGLRACCQTGKPVAALAQRIFDELAAVPVLSIPDDHPERYAQAKAVSYGSLYGQQAQGLANKLNISSRAAQILLDQLHEACPRLRRQAQAAAQHGWRTGLLPIVNGLERHLQRADYIIPGRVDRLAANTRIQGAAASCFRAVTVCADAVIRRYGGEILLPLHDGIHYTAPRSAMPALVPELRAAMQATFARMFNTDLVPPVSSAWAKARGHVARP